MNRTLFPKVLVSMLIDYPMIYNIIYIATVRTDQLYRYATKPSKFEPQQYLHFYIPSMNPLDFGRRLLSGLILLGFRPQFYGPARLPETTLPPSYPSRGKFSLISLKIHPTVYNRIANPSRGARQLEWASCLASAGPVTLAGGTTFLHINTLTILIVAIVTKCLFGI